ncbi:MAG: 2-amino-4-hydroxy-6-hydroxymethyldihydropteridine diphosphokinase [Fibrobacter sp.]|nr:2-amino-4-hydroxy-6-hydroxymethyldihydropteridine diphosphokinase [Fibrobacter sp.]
MREKKQVFVALGSNIGFREKYLRRARVFLREIFPGFWQESPLYVTAPVGPEGQDDYLNQVVSFNSDWGAMDVLREFKRIEMLMGRQKRERWGAREIDIDLLYLGRELIDTEQLSVPHLSIAQRSFVLKPMYDLAPEFYDVRTKETIATMLLNLQKSDNYTSAELWSPNL